MKGVLAHCFVRTEEEDAEHGLMVAVTGLAMCMETDGRDV